MRNAGCPIHRFTMRTALAVEHVRTSAGSREACRILMHSGGGRQEGLRPGASTVDAVDWVASERRAVGRVVLLIKEVPGGDL